jgi:anti-sigma factor RsiW
MTTSIMCRDLVELISDYLEGALSPEMVDAIETHLAGCDGCTRVLDEFRRTIAMMGELREEYVSHEQRALLLQTFRDWVSD